MCDPVTAASFAASAAGSYLQSKEQEKNLKRQYQARNQAYQDSIGRQRAFQEQTANDLRSNVQQQGAQAFNNNLESETDRRQKAFISANEGSPDYLASTRSSTPKNVAAFQERVFGEKQAESDRDATNLARLGAYGGARFNQGMGQTAFRRNLGEIVDQASRDQALLPLEMQAAQNNATKGASLFPQLLKLGGTAVGLYNAAGAPGWYDTVAAPPSPEFIGPMQVTPGYGSQLDSVFGLNSFFGGFK